jgi:quinol-cytochrome oxidoreductase complex cytochrome b subunit
VGPKTLSIFFVLHIAILPILILLATAFHFWLVRKAGGVMLPQAGGQPIQRRNLVAVRPHLIVREGVAALVLLAALLLFAALVPAPLQEQANPGMSPNPAKAPWYFMGIQELLVHVHPLFAVFVVPLLALVLLVALPYVRYGEGPSGLWFHSEKGRRTALAACFAALVLTPAYVAASEYVLRWAELLPFLPQSLSNGVAPTLLWVGIVVGVSWLALRLFAASRLEAAQAAFTFAAVAFFVLTMTGIFFRGEAMRLVWPW